MKKVMSTKKSEVKNKLDYNNMEAYLNEKGGGKNPTRLW